MARRKSFSEYRRENTAQKARVDRLFGYMVASRRMRGLDSSLPTKEDLQAAWHADVLVRDPQMSHLSQEQRDYIASLIITVEMTGTPVTDEHTVLQNNRCFENARDLVTADESGRIAYVEGVIVDPDWTTHHAWNEIDGVPFDVTKVINLKVHEGLETGQEYRGEIISREQLADRESRRTAARAQWTLWHQEHEEEASTRMKDFFDVHGDEYQKLGFNCDQEAAVWDVIWSQIEGYDPQFEKAVSYFSHTEMYERFGYESDDDWAAEWVKERLAETTKRMTPGGAHQGTTPSECAA